MFELKNVSKQYGGAFALNDVSMTIGKGLNFIVGASGSGKTTLLKIISGMEQNFDGAVTYCGKSIKDLSANEKSYFYNNVFGFVWQDFNLLEDSTVMENVLLPQYLKSTQNKKNAENALKNLKIQELAWQKVRYLSGGQKQRVAIARELVKNPQVILADEPTSALDEKTSKTTMDILRAIAKTRTVIVVTHDTALITEKDNVYELDKGELVSKPERSMAKMPEMKLETAPHFSFQNAFRIAKSNVKNKLGRFVISTLSLVIASVLLLTTVSGAIGSSSQGEFDKLIKTYGDALTDISIINSFTDAAGTDGKDNKKPSGDVNQDIGGLYDLYAKDGRVSFIAYLQAMNEIKITQGGKDYLVQSSGNMPVINKIVAGQMPMGDGNEVVVPESFVKQLGVSKEQTIGKEIEFSGSIYDWSTGKAVSKSVSCKAKIVGVIDTTSKYEYDGKIDSFTVDDSFFFSQTALRSMYKQAGTDGKDANFLMRAKTPADMIAIKDELSAKGIVPLGRFELVEDVVRLNNQTTKQSGSASVIIGVLSLVMVAAIFLITGVMRRKEHVIYKVSGFNTAHLCRLQLAEIISVTCVAILLMLATSPLINIATKGLFGVPILSAKMLFTGVLMMLITAALAYFTTAITVAKVNVSTVLKTGDK